MASSTPWNAEDLRRNASSWTLEGDAKLLEYMQTIAGDLEKRAQITNTKMSDMVLNTQETSVSLENITNKLSALQHSQFVENRVYEDDETIANISEVPTDVPNDNERYDPIKTLNMVLKNSISMMNKCYQRVSIDIEDSDDEEGLSKSIVYKPKNLFEQQPLPHIIGSKEWKEKWHIGLCDTDEEFSDEENKDEYSESSENASLSASLPSNAPTISESESSVWGLHPGTNLKRPPIYSPSSDEEVSSNTMTSKTSSEEIQKLSSNKPIIPPSYMLPTEDQKYYIHKPKVKGLFDESSEESDEGDLSSKSQMPINQQIPYKVVNGISNIFSDEPPELDEVDRKDDNENSQLFYETDEEIVKQNRIKNVNRSKEEKFSNIRKKPVNLFDDDDFESFMKELDKKTNEKLSQSKKEKSVTNLFDDINQEEREEIMVSPKQNLSTGNQNEITAELKSKIEIKKSLFESEPEDNIFENIINKARTMETTSRKKVRNLFDDESDDEFENIFRKGAKIEEKISESSAVGSKPKNSDSENNTSNRSLFENKNVPPLFSHETLEDDDPFNVMQRRSESVASSLAETERQKEDSTLKLKGVDLFSNIGVDEEDLFSSPKPPPVPLPRSTKKEDHSSSDALKTENVVPAKENQLSHESIAPNSPVTTGKTPVNHIASQPINNKQNISINQIGADDSNISNSKLQNPINAPKTTTDVTPTKDEKEQNKSRNILSNIFFNNEPPDDDDDIFNTSRKKSELDVSASNSSNFVEDAVGVSSPLNTEISNNKTDYSNFYEDSNELKIEQGVVERISEGTTVLNKFKLPSLFDDVTVEDEDFLFSSPNISSHKSVSSSCEHISANENKIIEKENKLKTSSGEEQIVTAKVKVDSSKETLQEQLQNSEDLFTTVEKNTSLKLDDSENSFQEDKKLDDSTKKDIFEPENKNFFLEAGKSSDVSPVENKVYEYNISSSTTEVDVCPKSERDNEKATLKKAEETDDNKTSASIFSTINLFQDIPPEDDFQNSIDTKRLHNIFYDDFAETITSTKAHTRRQSINYFFSDEPPPDSFDDDTISEPENEKKSIEVNDDKLISGMNDEPKITNPMLGKEANMSEMDQSEPDNSILSVSELIKKAGKEQTYSKPKLNAPIPKRLHTNLNINVAALIPGAKRPSITTNEDFKVQTSIENKNSSPPLSSDRIEKFEDDQSYVIPQNVPLTSEDNLDPNRLPSLNKTRVKIQAKRHPSTRKGRRESLKKSLSLDTPYIAIGVKLNPNDIKNFTEEAKLSSEAINREPNSSSSNKFPANNLDLNKHISTQQNSALLDDLHKSLEDDWLTRSIKVEKNTFPTESSEKMSENSIKSINTVFDESDDDDLFASSLKASVSKIAQLPIYTEEKPKEMLKTETKTTTETDKSIFHDDSDDSLFGNVQKQRTDENLNAMSKQKVNTQAKIFSSDEDDDDLFSKSFKTTKKVKAPKKLFIPTSQSLFGDDEDEDEDDLFGPTTAKTKSKAPINAVKAPKKQEKKSPAGSITEDNPLADLLNG